MVQIATPLDIERAANILADYANLMAESNTINADGKTWPDDEFSQGCRELVVEYSALAKRLRALATRELK